MDKVYTVELETEQMDIESFWMYQGFGNDLAEAEKCAEMLSRFFPYDEYPTRVFLYVEDEMEDGRLINKRVLKEYELKNEDGAIVRAK
ncbi:hypothetical protein HCG49_16585 [Arenibacter sp. 6A1]|uniref:hypothetical protein n=1 Tax=Arenibacter sp. 6A1 TaxID=2720391 RepID=UPI00144885F2|nr:hypothetical protein [Arenibacter sp. 6A1]NKI28173.1 hypothetical protein [Arenibacter sp. 6A1]